MKHEMTLPTCPESSFHMGSDGNHKCTFTQILRPVLVLGKIIGVVNIDGLFTSGDPDHWHPSQWNYFGSSIALLAILGHSINVILDIIVVKTRGEATHGEIVQTVEKFGVPTADTYFLLICILSWTKRKEFLKLLVKFHHVACVTKVTRISWTPLIFCMLIMTFGVVENVLFDIVNIEMSPTTEESLLVKLYFCKSMGNIRAVVSYNPIIVIIRFIIQKLATYAWNYNDVILIILSRQLAWQYQSLGFELAEYCSKWDQLGYKQDWTIQNRKASSTLRTNFSMLHERLRKIIEINRNFNSFFAPTLMSLYLANIYCISIVIHNSLTRPEYLHGYGLAYTIVFITQFITRIVLVTLSCGEIHHQASNLRIALETMLPLDINAEDIISKLRKSISGPFIGVDVYGIYTIKRSTVLSIINFLFSFQIILLQATPAKP